MRHDRAQQVDRAQEQVDQAQRVAAGAQQLAQQALAEQHMLVKTLHDTHRDYVKAQAAADHFRQTAEWREHKIRELTGQLEETTVTADRWGQDNMAMGQRIGELERYAVQANTAAERHREQAEKVPGLLAALDGARTELAGTREQLAAETGCRQQLAAQLAEAGNALREAHAAIQALAARNEQLTGELSDAMVHLRSFEPLPPERYAGTLIVAPISPAAVASSPTSPATTGAINGRTGQTLIDGHPVDAAAELDATLADAQRRVDQLVEDLAADAGQPKPPGDGWVYTAVRGWVPAEEATETAEQAAQGAAPAPQP